MRESDLSAPVTAWLTAQGLGVWAEVPSGEDCGAIDLVGYGESTDRIVIVELKISASRALLYQCCRARRITRYAYGCVATSPRECSRAAYRAEGIGLLRVDGGIIVTLEAPLSYEERPPKLGPRWYRADMRAKLLARLRTHPRDGIGGRTCSDHRPAHECLLAVIEYLHGHPTASWREIYDAVPNHYASMRSMRQTLRARVDFNLDRPEGWKIVLKRRRGGS